MGLLNARLFFTPTSPLDLTAHDSGDVSPSEDLIIFWFALDPVSDNNITLTVQLSSGNDVRNWASYDLKITSKAPPASASGLASILEVKNAQGELLARTDFVSEADRNSTLETIAEKTWIANITGAQYAAIPKRLFATASSFDFTDVTRIDFIFHRVSFGDVLCIGDVQLVGGGKDDSGSPPSGASKGGVQGTYRYRVTFRNTTTGNRSNPSPVTQIAKDVNRGYVALSGLPTSSDSQVDAREIWRTMGDGTRFFKIDQIDDNSTTTYDDQVADYAGLDSQEGVKVMTTEELPLDNDVPDSSFDHHIIDKLTTFWISSTAAKSGRLYYSPIGRPESQKGYIDVSSAGDPLQRLVIFQGVRYVFSESKLYRITGDDPYFSFEIAGVPGVSSTSRRTVTATPYGIMWQANDGIRLYNGARSTLVGFDALGKLFRGESAENLSAFEGTVAEFARGEYYISDGSQCLAYEVNSNTWRDVGFGDITALYYEWDTDKLQGARAAQVELLEEEGTTDDDGTAIDIAWEMPPGSETPHDAVLFIERAVIDIDTNGETITPTLIHQYASDALATISNAARGTVEREIQELLLRPAIRLTGSVSNRVTVYDVAFEYRHLVLGINIEGSDRMVIPGRWREDLGSNGRIVFEIDPSIKALDQTDRLYVLDRLTVEADTEGTTVTPNVQLENNTVTLSALSTATTRLVNTYQIDRIGPLNEVQLDGVFFADATRPKIYRVEAHMRELTLGVNITTNGQSVQVPGRSILPGTSMIFEVQPIQQMFNNLGQLYFIERLVIESDTNGTSITPSIKIGGVTITLDAFSTSARGYTEIDVERVGPIENVTLSGDFESDVQIFGINMFLRPVTLGVKLPGGERLEIDGRASDAGTELLFDIDPNDRRFDAQSNVPLVERLYIDADTSSSNITPIITMENQTVGLDFDSTSTRDTMIWDVNYIGRLRNVRLIGDFVNNAVKLYGVELQVRHLEMGVNILSNS